MPPNHRGPLFQRLPLNGSLPLGLTFKLSNHSNKVEHPLDHEMASQGRFVLYPPRMRAWWKLALLTTAIGLVSPTYGVSDPLSWLWKSREIEGLPCSVHLLEQLFKSASLRTRFSQSSFLKFAAEMPPRFGLPPELVQRRYQALVDHPELAELMGGMELPATVGQGLSVSAAWGADYNFLPNYAHWQKVRENLPSLVDRMGRRLHLDPILEHQLFAADETSVSDSGWVIVSSQNGKEKIDSTIKITFFDYDTTPDGAWPRYYFESLLTEMKILHFRRPRELSDYEANLVLEGFFTLKSSLDYWGIFPSELETGYRFPEHEQVFDREYLWKQREISNDLLDHFGQPDVAQIFAKLQDLRKKIPQNAREMAELQRFNIPVGANPASKAQVFYGMTVLLSLRPIKTVVALSPRPGPPPGEVAFRPSWEIGFVAPGFEWLADAARAAGAEMDREKGILPGPLPDPEHDALREMYESLGLEVTVTYPYMMGLPNGCHIYRAPRDRFLRRIIAYQEKHPQYLTAAQLKVIREIKGGLHEE